MNRDNHLNSRYIQFLIIRHTSCLMLADRPKELVLLFHNGNLLYLLFHDGNSL